MFAQVIDFLKEDRFIKHVLNETPESSSYWERYFALHPEQKEYAQEVRDLLEAPAEVACDLSPDENCELKNRIFNSIAKLV